MLDVDEITTRSDLDFMLSDLDENEAGIFVGHYQLDLKWVFVKNCPESFKSDSDILPAWLSKPGDVLEDLKKFCRSKLKKSNLVYFVWFEHHRHRSIAPFDGTEYGEEYLSLYPGQLVVKLGDDEDWTYGFKMSTGACGWFPPNYVVAVGAAGGA